MKQGNFTLFILSALWSVLILFGLFMDSNMRKNSAIELAKKEAVTYLKKDKAFRYWATSHGGVYVPADERTPPNPYLSHIIERDITTPSGKKLTLMNPAYMMRQMMADYHDLYGIKGKITSFPDKLLNKVNMPDQWELKALKLFQEGLSETAEITNEDGTFNYRYMQSLKISKGCLKCHGFQDYEIGDIRGGIGVSIPMEPYLKGAEEMATIHLIIAAVVWLFGLGLLFLFRHMIIIQQREKHQAQLNSELHKLSSLDGLTGINNRRSLDAAIDNEWKRAQRSKSELALIMIDVDNFKLFNDRNGHLEGDNCLKKIAKALERVIKRPADIVARYGGEEFTLLLPETTLNQAAMIAEECLASIRKQKIPFSINQSEIVTISVGVASCRAGPEHSPLELVRAADSALFQAKNNGRNQACIYQQ